MVNNDAGASSCRAIHNIFTVLKNWGTAGARYRQMTNKFVLQDDSIGKLVDRTQFSSGSQSRIIGFHIHMLSTYI